MSFEELKQKQYETISISLDSQVNSLLVITFTRPKRMNSYIPKQYSELAYVFDNVENIPEIRAVLWRAEGKFFSSGHDLGFQMKEMAASAEKGITRETIKSTTDSNASLLVKSLINFNKPIIVACQGSAYGIACTSLALCDIVYASEVATFQTPFMKFAFCAEGCSSILFPQIMGRSKANEMLLMGKTMTAKEAKECNFVADVFPADQFDAIVLERARIVASYPPNALVVTKKLVKTKEVKDELLRVNEREMEELTERFLSEECVNAVTSFMMNRQSSKL